MKTVIEMWHKAWPDAGAFVRASAQDLERFAALVRADERARMAEQPAPVQQEPVGALTIGGIIDTSDGPEYEDWDIEWNSKAIEALQDRLVTGDPVTLSLYTSPQPAQQESESNKAAYQRGYLDGMAKPCIECADRQWVLLTSEQIQEMSFTAVKENWDWLRFARAIEAAHGIKENT